MTSYLMIENPGVCPIEGFTILGATTKKQTNRKDIIGMFGSGNKHAVATLLRQQISPIVFCSNTRLDFTTKSITIDSDLDNHSFERVVVNYSGDKSGSEDLGFVLNYGEQDWHTLDMALREFVSNAVDHAILFNEKHNYPEQQSPWQGVEVKIINQSEIILRKGWTRIFIPCTKDIFSFYENLGKWFLHFIEPISLSSTILLKQDRHRNLDNSNVPVIYRRGVRVREFECDKDIPSLFDYNLADLEIDECRNASDWDCRMSCAKAIVDATPEQISSILLFFLEGKTCWEHKLDGYGLTKRGASSDIVQLRRANWLKAIQLIGEKCVLSSHKMSTFVANKGWTPIILPEEWLSALSYLQLPTHSTILNINEQKGIEIVDPSRVVVDVLHQVWNKIVDLHLSANKSIPNINCFHTLLNSQCFEFGFQRDNNIFVNVSISQGITTNLYHTVLHELAHYITEATDGTADFEHFLTEFGTLAAFSTCIDGVVC